MKSKSTVVRSIVAVSACALVAAGYPLRSHAGMIGTEAALSAQDTSARTANLEKLDRALARAEVQQQLAALGVDAADARARAAALPDADLERLAKRVDGLPAAGDDGLLALIGLVFVVLLVLDYLDVIHIFSHKHR